VEKLASSSGLLRRFAWGGRGISPDVTTFSDERKKSSRVRGRTKGGATLTCEGQKKVTTIALHSNRKHRLLPIGERSVGRGGGGRNRRERIPAHTFDEGERKISGKELKGPGVVGRFYETVDSNADDGLRRTEFESPEGGGKGGKLSRVTLYHQREWKNATRTGRTVQRLFVEEAFACNQETD